MKSILSQLLHSLIASRYCLNLIGRVFYIRWLVYSKTATTDVVQLFPQLRWANCVAACQAIVDIATNDDELNRLQKQRMRCHQLWREISALGQSCNRVCETKSGIVLRKATLVRSVELILGDSLESLEIKLPLIHSSHGKDLRKVLLGWLIMAGADRSLATRRSLIFAARYAFTDDVMDITTSAESIVLSQEQQAMLTAQQAKLDGRLNRLYKRSHRDTILQEYIAHDLALTSLPESYCRALASKTTL